MSKPPLRFIFDNLGWLLASLGLAFIVWYAAVSTADPIEQRRFTVQTPIEIRVDEGLVVVNRPQAAVQVTVRGLRSALSELDARSIVLSADLTTLPPRDEAYNARLVGRLQNVRGCAVTDVQPAQIAVTVARRLEQLKNVTVRFTQEAPVGYVASATPAQPTVLVSGPEAKVQQVREVQARISLQDQRASFTRLVSLQAVDENNNPVTDVLLAPAEISVTIEIQQRSDVTELAVEPRFIGQIPNGYLRVNQRWEPRRVIVRGLQPIIDRLGGVIYTEPIDLTNQRETFTETVKLALPFGVEMPDPTNITVTVEIEAVPGSREFTGIPVQKRGLDPADFEITIRPDRVNVIVRGPQVLVDTLSPGDITVFAALNGLPAGTHQVTLQASITKAGAEGSEVIIPNNRAEAIIVARTPTSTPTPGPTATPAPTPSPTPGVGSFGWR